MNTSGSAVVDTMKSAALESWKKWRDHVAAGTADSPEALAAYDDAQLASKAWAGEVDARKAAERDAQRAA